MDLTPLIGVAQAQICWRITHPDIVVVAQLDHLQTSIQNDLTQDIQNELELVRQGLQHKEQELANYDQLLIRLGTM